MLKNLLYEISKLNSFTQSQIGENLGIPESMVGDLIQQLVRMDYLNEIISSPSCETSCGLCPYAKSCNVNPIKMYKISPKGKELLKNISKI